MPKSKAKRPAKKAARASVKRTRPAAPTTRKTKKAGGSRIDPRVVAAIELALHAEESAATRAGQVQEQLSPWTALGRVSIVRAR